MNVERGAPIGRTKPRDELAPSHPSLPKTGGRLAQSGSALDSPIGGRRVRVLDHDPIRRAPGAIRPIPPLGDDDFEPHAAGVVWELDLRGRS